MISMNADRRPAPERYDGNGVDVRYLLDARLALVPVIAATQLAAGQAASRHVRSLARLALSEQVGQLATITACLREWGHADTAESLTDDVEGLAGLGGSDLDLAFAALLVRHAETSLTCARTEMVGGASRVARPIAEATIHQQYRQLAALELLARTGGLGSTGQEGDAWGEGLSASRT